MTRGLFLAALAGLCLAAGPCLTTPGAAQPSDPPRSPTASLSADSESAAAATGNSTHVTVPQRLRTTILTNGAGRTLIVLGRGESKR